MGKTNWADRLDPDVGVVTSWDLPGRLFKDPGADINDFEIHCYNRFLDDVRSRSDLVEGLEALSPFADDALDIALRMSEEEFIGFKLALAHERGIASREEFGTQLKPRYFQLVVPTLFAEATLVAEEWAVPLGVVLIRLMDRKMDRKSAREE
jgi:hypothetical protein